MIGIISLNHNGDIISKKISNHYGVSKVSLLSKTSDERFNLKEATKNLWNSCEGIIFIASTGIAIRAIAPLIEHKSKDPAIIVVDVNGLFSISLLSGHLGGANSLAKEIGLLLNATPVITTATDNIGVHAPDLIAKENNLIIEDFKKIKIISSVLIDKKEVYFKDDFKTLDTPKGYKETKTLKENTLWITNKIFEEGYKEKSSLRLIKKNIVLGIGCRRGVASHSLIDFVEKVLKENNIDKRAVKSIGSIDLKKNEKAIIDLGEYLNADYFTFTKGEIKKVQHHFKGSDFVEKSVGVRAVCEPAVLLQNGKMILEKLSYEGMTISIGEEAE